MRLSAKPIVNYTDINHFSYVNQWIVSAGDPNVLYFQLVDLDQGPANVIGGYTFLYAPPLSGNIGLRYMAGVGTSNQPVTLTVTFPSNAAALNTFNNDTNGGFIPFGSSLTFPVVDPAQVFTITAFQASPLDASIWAVSINSVQIPNSGNVQFALTEGTNTRRFFVTNMIDVQISNNGNC
jgi:hypothetical protein